MNTDLIRLNKEYYNKLVQAYHECKFLQIDNSESKFIELCTKITLRAIENKQNVIIQIPESFREMPILFCSVYVNLTNYAFLKFVNYPDFKIGDRLKGWRREYVIEEINEDGYTLQEIMRTKQRDNASGPLTIRGLSYEKLVEI